MNQIKEQIAALPVPGSSATLADVAKRLSVSVVERKLAVDVLLGIPIAAVQHGICASIGALARREALELSYANVAQRIAAHCVQPGVAGMPNIRNIIAVGSGKGGVGKSTTAVNLALALAEEGGRVGILDADIYGPSVPMMLGLSGRPDSPDGKSIEPMRAHGLEAMSIGLLVDQDTPMIWRGPMATSALTQLLTETRWGDLDYLIVDLPPGTGDIQLTLAQKIPVAGAVIVTTPQDIATLDARKALKMFEKVNVPVLGVIENMAVHVCRNCGHAEHLFGAGGGARMAEQYGVPLLGSLPLDIAIREQGDAGRPIVLSGPESATAQAYQSTARRLAIELAKRPHTATPLSVSLLGD